MLNFFRRLRRHLLSRGRVKRYLIYALGEILLVMIGILLALQVNNWNQERQARSIEQEFLAGLQIEMTSNRDQLISSIAAHKKNLRASHDLLHLFGTDVSHLTTSYIDSLFSDLILSWTYDPRLGKLNSIIMSGQLDYITNPELKTYLSSFQDEAVDAGELFVTIGDIRDDRMSPHIDKIISRRNRVNDLYPQDNIGRSSFPLNYQTLFDSFELESIIAKIAGYARYGLIEEEDHLKTIERILEIIEEEIDKTR